MKDVLLVLPSLPEGSRNGRSMLHAETSAPPIGLAYIASYLTQQGHSTAIEDLRLYDKTGDGVLSDSVLESVVSGIIEKHNPRFVGVSSKTQTYPNARRILQAVKSVSDIPVIAGGIHTTFLPKEALQDGFDFVVRREGEETISELIQAIEERKDYTQVTGISFMKDGKIINTPDRQYVRDLDSLPFPERDSLDLDKYIQRGVIITSRGCPLPCNFCSCGAFSNHAYRRRGKENIIAEMKEMESKYDISEFFFHDDTFTLQTEDAKALCKRIEEEFKDIVWGCQARADTMEPELAKSLYDAGCRAIQFGVESGNQEVLTSMRKGITLQQVEDAVSYVHSAGIPNITCSFIIGHPEDTEDSIADTINFARHLLDVGATYTPVSLLTPFPGTSIYKNAEAYGIKIVEHPWDQTYFATPLIETKNLTRERLKELYNIALGAIFNKIYEKAEERR
ncbi:radical SAM protein [Candidatus Woesearchaeota archaeon]|nr:radical SAM protein [Candidatus Woesearchaeota archaeon]